MREETGMSSLPDQRNIVGNSVALRHVLHQVEIVAPTDATVLLLGETGTGKELVARAIHDASRRGHRPFIKVNCAAIPSGLLESELFGHERGAFTGAIAQRIGRFELGDGGTLFLDEVGEIPLELQPKLLRVLQEHEFERLGGTRTSNVDVPRIAAPNRAPPPFRKSPPRRAHNEEGETLEGVERAYVARVLLETGWVIGGARGAAARLGLKRTTLQSMLKRFGLPLPRDAAKSAFDRHANRPRPEGLHDQNWAVG